MKAPPTLIYAKPNKEVKEKYQTDATGLPGRGPESVIVFF